MDKMTAALMFLGVCVVLSVLLVARVISPIWSGGIFTATLVAFGLLSRGFTKIK